MGYLECEGWTREHRILHDLGFFGHYLHFNVGGRSGKQHILAKLDKSGGCLSQRELQEHADISAAALSEVLAKLEAEGLVERERSTEDRRQMTVSLTQAGAERAVLTRRRFEEFERECFVCLDADEQERLLGLLDRLVRHWGTLERKGDCA